MTVTVAPQPSPEPEPAPARTDDPASKRSAARRVATLAAALLLVAAVATAAGWRSYGKLLLPMPTLAAAGAKTSALPAVVALAPAKASDPEPSWQVRHDGYVPVEGGILMTPKSFVTKEGDYDLILHFHGAAPIVRESVEHAGINAALAVINVGIRSAPYRSQYQSPESFDKLLAEIERGLKRRGVRKPKLRRLALTSWSAGYGAIESILLHRHSPKLDADPLDAIIALDGVHAGFVDGDNQRLSKRSMVAFLNAARAAAQGQLLVSLTHSQIDPVDYAGTQRTQEFILGAVGSRPHRGPMLTVPPNLQLPAAKGAVPQGKERRMVPISDTRVGQLRVQGFEGITAEHHSAHLTQMASVALPDLAKRWADKPGAAASARD